MSSFAIGRLLGPPPLFRGLFRWSLAVLFAFGAWHLYLWSPMPGLVAIGVTPVIAIFLFFRGLNLVARTAPYWKTWSLVRRLGLSPTWWDTGAGYLLMDETRGLWIVNGTGGNIVDIRRLHGRSDWQGHRLEIHMNDERKPAAFYGFGSAEDLRDAAERFGRAYAGHTGKTLDMTFEDLRAEEDAEEKNASKRC